VLPSMKNMALHQAELTHNGGHLHLAFPEPRRVLSSAVLNGGHVKADHVVNMKVPKTSDATEAPETTLKKYALKNGWKGTVVGLMTAASMDSFRLARDTVSGIELAVLVTSGLSNPRRIGDRADIREAGAAPGEAGTINIIALTSATLTEAAMVECVMMITEAKAAALQEAGIRSPVSNGIATGTGTDALAVVSGHGPQTVAFCGKHVLFGEVLGRLALAAVAASIDWRAG